MKTFTGLITKAISGFYYIEAADTLYECKARGIFRKKGISPVVGDKAEITVYDDGTAAIETILPRRNELIRPPLANRLRTSSSSTKSRRSQWKKASSRSWSLPRLIWRT